MTRYTLEQMEAVLPVEQPSAKVNSEHFAMPETIRSGDRHELLYKLLRSQKARGISVEAALAACHAENNAKCNPPIEFFELDTYLRRVWEQPDSPEFKEAAEARSADTFPATESGDAEFFAQCEAGLLRYNHRTRTWLIFTPDLHCWKPDADGEVHRRFLSAIRQRQKAAISLPGDDDRRRARVAWTLSGESRKRIVNGLSNAQNVVPLKDDGEGWDANPLLLAVANGVLDLERGQLRPGIPDDRITLASPVPFDPRASTVKWSQFVLDVCDGDHEQASYLQVVVGYVLTGSTSEQCFWILFGTGSNGKSTFLEILTRHLLPEHSWSMNFPSQKWSESMSEYQRAQLVARRLVVAKENEQAQRLNSEFMKSLTGNETIAARHPYGRPFNFQPEAKFFLAVNHKPVIRDETHGMWRRVRLVPFQRTFPVNPTFADSLIAEVPGALKWAVEGAVRYAREGLVTPRSVMVATEEYQQESNALAPFFAERCVLDSGKRTGAQALFDAYRTWCIDSQVPDVERVSQNEFGLRIRNDARFSVDQDRSTRRVFYVGVALIDFQRGDGQ